VRAEVEQLLRDMRLVPVLSGSATSGFQPLPDRNSIETCLANLRQCDAMIVILCQRYGRSLKLAGFPDMSATHLEYTEAKSANIPIHMYVRDRLEADYCISRKNEAGDVELVWVREQQDRRLFELLREHRTLAQGLPGSNWFDTFRDSVELKTLIKRDFGGIALRNELETLIAENRVPIMALAVKTTLNDTGEIIVKITICNAGTVPAYRLSWVLEDRDENRGEIPVLAPQQETFQTFVIHNGWHSMKCSIAITYYTPQGHRIHDDYSIGTHRLSATLFISGATCQAKTYHVATGGVRPYVIARR
jgi:hypothetical protein